MHFCQPSCNTCDVFFLKITVRLPKVSSPESVLSCSDLRFASATDRRPSGMGISVYTAAASSIPLPLAAWPSQPAGVFRNFVTCDKAHFTRRVAGVSRTRQPVHHTSASRPLMMDDVASRSGPSLRPPSLTARVERAVRHSEAATAALNRSRLALQATRVEWKWNN